jgi:hypothetical protein
MVKASFICGPVVETCPLMVPHSMRLTMHNKILWVAPRRCWAGHYPPVNLLATFELGVFVIATAFCSAAT